MKKHPGFLSSAGVFALALIGVTVAGLIAAASLRAFGSAEVALAQPDTPSVVAIDPAAAPNDIHTPVTIMVAGFTPDASGTPPVVSLVSASKTTFLTDVSWSGDATLTATVPWGMDPGTYDLAVRNADDSSSTAAGAFTVLPGIGLWNGGTLFGGEVDQILMKPGDPNTLYAPAYNIRGLFRSTDAGEHWAHVGTADLWLAWGKLAVDPLHPGWLYAATWKGLQRSQDDGDTWTTLHDNTWPGETAVNQATTEAYPSPYDAGVVFIASHDNYPFASSGGALGLARSTDGGTTWAAVHDLDGLSVVKLAFDPNDSSKMALVTSDARVFRSSNKGAAWNEAAKPPISNIAMSGLIVYNPYVSGQVWIASAQPSAGIFKSTDASMTNWLDVTQSSGMGAADLAFTGPLTVYNTWHHSEDGGTSWDVGGPFAPVTANGQLIFPPDGTRTAYIGDGTVGVLKTTDGGTTWNAKNQGLTGMMCSSMAVLPTKPLQVFATFGNSFGVYRSDDGANSWRYLSFPTSTTARAVCPDPTSVSRVYAIGDRVYLSNNDGQDWNDEGLNLSPSEPEGTPWVISADPFQAGHLVLAVDSGNYLLGAAYLYHSSDYGVHWERASVDASLTGIQQVAFDPETSGTVYATTGGSGVYKSADGGSSWGRIDDRGQPAMRNTSQLAIATHPQNVVLVAAGEYAYRSTDGGATWARGGAFGGTKGYMFADNNSTRLYGASAFGLFFSTDLGASWTPAAGAFGRTQILGLGSAIADGHTVIYAATTGGSAGAAGGASVASARSSSALGARPAALSAASTSIAAGIYRYVQVPKTKTFWSSASQDGWVLESRHTSNVGGSANAASTTLRLGDNPAKKQYRSILSFYTSDLPDSAVITKVTLRVKRQGVAGGGNPVTKFQGFRVDMKKGYFGNSAALRSSDFQASAGRSYGTFKPSLTSDWYNIGLTSGKAYINKTSSRSGRTQIRLRFKKDDNGNAIANYLRLYSGNGSAASRPQLVVTYYVP